MAALNHVHRYEKTKLGKKKDYIIFRCVLPGCSHFVLPETLKGRECECFICHKTFILGPLSKLTTRPHCSDCRLKPSSTSPKVRAIRKETIPAAESELLDKLLTPEEPKKEPTVDELMQKFKRRFGSG
jgi:hypothetical protein